jgi:hypothetical protein
MCTLFRPIIRQIAILKLCTIVNSVADPGCSSRILIFTHPGSRIPDPKTATKERDEKKNFQTIFCSHKFYKIVKLFYF